MEIVRDLISRTLGLRQRAALGNLWTASDGRRFEWWAIELPTPFRNCGLEPDSLTHLSAGNTPFHRVRAILACARNDQTTGDGDE